MPVQVVTDSTADIPLRLTESLEIEVAPVYVYFGKTTYRDGIDISPAEFYRELEHSPFHPTTSQPSVGDFVSIYNRLADKGASGIVSVHISSKISGTFSSALRAADMVKERISVEVVDSGYNSIGLGLIAIAAARLARTGACLHNVLEETRHAIAGTDMYGIFDTLKYIIRGGRISKAKAAVASVIGVKPMLKFSGGAIVQGGLARTYNKGVDKLVDFIKNKKGILSLAIAHSCVPDEALKLSHRLGDFFSEKDIIITELGPALGAHGGPGVLLVAVRSTL
ncbi:MAG: DegV family protein [Dehalococcoidaceae bacterium]|nr:DegV family protein [Dehalococcoidaceae bacterium]